VLQVMDDVLACCGRVTFGCHVLVCPVCVFA
jgi:hypothetical protein